MALRDSRELSRCVGEWENWWGNIFLTGYGNLMRNDFDNRNLFQSENQHSVNIDHQLISKLPCTVCKEYEGKIKMVQSQWSQLKIIFYWVITWKLFLVRGEMNLLLWWTCLLGGGGRGLDLKHSFKMMM